MESGYIFIADNIFPSLLAISSEEQAQGLMFKPWPPPIMSFIYSKPQLNKFWMHNTPSALDILFCCDNKITQICKGTPFSTEVLGSNDFSDLVIELPYGTTSQAGIKVGHSVGIVSPNKSELQKIVASKAYKYLKK